VKITAWDIDRFGLWKELSASGLSDGLTVFYGPNEAGKTTLMQFVRAMLYGFGGERRRYVGGPFPVFGNPAGDHAQPLIAGSGSFDHTYDFRQPNSPEAFPVPLAGGTMSVRSSFGSFLLKRQFDPAKHGREESFAVSSLDGRIVGDLIFNQLTSEIDEATFNNVFAIGLDELQQLGILEDTEAEEMLYRLTIGIDRVSLLETVRSLVQSRNHLIDPTGKPAQIGKLIARHMALQNEVARTHHRLREFGEVLAEQQRHERVAGQIETELKKLQRESRLYETVILIADVWDARTSVDREIKRMGEVVPVSDETLAKLDEASQRIARQRELLAGLKKSLRETKKKYDEIEVNEDLRKFTPRLEVVLEQDQWIRDLEEQIKETREKVRGLEKNLADAEKETSGVSGNNPASGGLKALTSKVLTSPVENPSNSSSLPDAEKHAVPVSPKRLHDYRIPARAVSVARSRYKKAKEQYKQTTEKNRILSDKIGTELSNRKIEDISEAIEKTGEMVNHLRRRQTIQQRFDEMVQYRRELDRQNAFLVQHQAVPGWGLLLIGAGVILFGIMMLIPLLGPLAGYASRYEYLVIGLPGFAGSIAAKFLIERRNAQKLQVNQRQISMLASQMEHAKQEAAAIDARYPGQGKPIEVRFQAAQVELAALEKLVPLDGQRKDVAYHTEKLDDRLKKAKHSLLFAQKRWRDWLASSGLPENTKPADIHNLLGHYVQFGGVQRQYDLKAEELAMRRREMEMLTGQILRVAQTAGMTMPDNATALTMLARIRKLIDENEQLAATRKTLKTELRKTSKLRKQEAATLVQWHKQRQELLDRHQVKHDGELKQLAKLYQDYQACVEKRKQWQREIDLAVGGFCTEAEITELFEPDKRETLAPALERIRGQMEQLSKDLRDELEKKGRAAQQIADIGRDRSVTGKQLELAMLENRIAKSISQWQVYGLATRVLEEIRTEYELQRQPETLNETGRYFEAMTEGRYKRVWTPIGETSLRVDDFAGNSFDVSWLSRGTREQLFVAIRLALAATFERHGVSLPLVLDDVLVNYDLKRAFAAAKTLLDFSNGGNSGRQIFLFTCHEHICEMFHSLDVPVCVLPAFSDEKKVLRPWIPPRNPEPVFVAETVVEDSPKPVVDLTSAEIPVEPRDSWDGPFVIEDPTVDLDGDNDIYDLVVDDNDINNDTKNNDIENSVADLPSLAPEPEPPKITVIRQEKQAGIPKPKRQKHKKMRRGTHPTQKNEPKKKELKKTVDVDLSQNDSLRASDQAKEHREETDEWAEHFFDDHDRSRTFQAKLAKIEKIVPKIKKSVEPPQIGNQYGRDREGLVFDVDFFDPVHDATTKNTVQLNSPSDDEPFIKGFFDDDEN